MPTRPSARQATRCALRPPPIGGAVLVCLFHLNLAFSSLPAERRPEIVERCYWPMLELARRRRSRSRSRRRGGRSSRSPRSTPTWIAAARELIEAGRAELVGSSYAQCAAPLLPGRGQPLEPAARARRLRARCSACGPRRRCCASRRTRPASCRCTRRPATRRSSPTGTTPTARHPEWPLDDAARAAAGRRRRRREPPGHLERVDRVPEVPALRARRARPRALRRVRARRGRATAARCCCTPTTPRCSTTGRAASPPSRPRGRASGTASPRR